MIYDTIISFYVARSRYLGDQIAFLRKQIDGVDGRLMVRFAKGKPRFFRSTQANRYGTYLGVSSHDEVVRLAQKDFNSRLLIQYEREKELVDEWCKTLESFADPETVLLSIPISYRSLCSIPKVEKAEGQMTEDQIQKWLHQQFYGVPQRPNQKKDFFTMKHERVKSKSEVLVADRLFMGKLPYLYEKPLWLGRSDGYVYPDFTILNPKTGEEIYWEHCGKMDDQDYLADFMDKLGKYARAGHVLGKDLFMTFETSSKGLNTIVVDGIVATIAERIMRNPDG